MMSRLDNQIIPNFVERESCPVCHNKNIKLISKFTISSKEIKSMRIIYDYENNEKNITIFRNKKVDIFKCHNCELLFHGRVPDEETLDFVYSKLISKKESFKKYKKNEEKSTYKALKLLKRLKSIIKFNSLKNNRYIDFGFGWGLMLRTAKSLGLLPYGIEQDKSKIIFINKSKMKVYQSIDDLVKKEKDDIKFSLLTINQVLEHVTFPNKILSDLRKISSEKSILFISVPNYINKKVLSSSDIFKKGPLQPFEHLNCFSRKSIKILAKNSNWELITLKYIFGNFFFLTKRYNVLILLLISLFTMPNKGRYYLIPKR